MFIGLRIQNVELDNIGEKPTKEYHVLQGDMEIITPKYSDLSPSSLWFRRNVNQGYFLLSIVIPVTVVIVVVIIQALLMPTSTKTMLATEDSATTGMWEVWLVISIVYLWQVYCAVWIVRHKGRSVLWALSRFIPDGIGFIVILYLQNREQKQRSRAEDERIKIMLKGLS